MGEVGGRRRKMGWMEEREGEEWYNYNLIKILKY